MSDVEVSERAGRYLAAILLISERAGRPAKTGEVADRLDVNPASVTEQVRSLDDRGFADYEKYEGVTLTESGEAATRELMWKHCLAENFADEELGLGDASTASLGHALSDDAAAALGDLIDHPCRGACRAPDADFDECRTDEF